MKRASGILLPRKEKRLPLGAVSSMVSDATSASGRRKRARKRTTTRIVLLSFRSKRQTRRSNCRLCHWNFHVRRRSNEARAAERYCVQTKRKRCASPEEPPECAAV